MEEVVRARSQRVQPNKAQRDHGAEGLPEGIGGTLWKGVLICPANVPDSGQTLMTG
jgi:hypothetical protein